MSLTPSPTACRWETFESHHSLKHGKPVQPFVRSLRIFVSGALPRLPFYSRRLLPTAELGGCSAACSLPLLHLLMLDMPDWGRNTRIPLLPCYTLRVARYALRGTA